MWFRKKATAANKERTAMLKRQQALKQQGVSFHYSPEARAAQREINFRLAPPTKRSGVSVLIAFLVVIALVGGTTLFLFKGALLSRAVTAEALAVNWSYEGTPTKEKTGGTGRFKLFLSAKKSVSLVSPTLPPKTTVRLALHEAPGKTAYEATRYYATGKALKLEGQPPPALIELRISPNRFSKLTTLTVELRFAEETGANPVVKRLRLK